jgi:hypothetical protein
LESSASASASASAIPCVSRVSQLALTCVLRVCHVCVM